MKITSTDNSKIKYLCSLKKKSVRDKDNRVFLEGERIVCDCERFGAQLESVYYSESYMGEIPQCDEKYELCARAFEKIAETVSPQGIAAVAKMPQCSADDITEQCVILCDNVRDPGNMGTIIRTAHAVGAAVLLTTGCVDIFNLKTVRSSMGSVFATKCALCGAGEIKKMQSRGYKLLCGMLCENSHALFETDLHGKKILAVGNEANGIGTEIASLADSFVTIPMPGCAESLNAAVSASVMAYEHLRQNTAR